MMVAAPGGPEITVVIRQGPMILILLGVWR